MKITKALITAAGPDQRKLPLQTLIDRDRTQKTFLEILINEIRTAGIDEINSNSILPNVNLSRQLQF
jgi:UTP--glucose-1-phosphate uridylyltransferase